MKGKKEEPTLRPARLAAIRRRQWFAHYSAPVRRLPPGRAGQGRGANRSNPPARWAPVLSEAVYICCPFTRWPA